MKKLVLVFILILSPTVFAKAKAPKGTPKLSTAHDFDGQTVGGKIQAPLEAITEVENEKEIDHLIGVRKNFNDRSRKAKGLR